MSTLKNINYETRGLNPFRAEVIKKYNNNSVLDVGCGNGKYVKFFHKDINIHGCDIYKSESWDFDNSLFKICNACNLDYIDNAFSLVTAFEVLEHIVDYDKAISELKRVSNKYIAITVPRCDLTDGMINSRLLFYTWLDQTHVNFWKEKEIIRILQKHNLKIIDSYPINKINLGEFLVEVFRIPNFLKSFFAKVFNRIPMKKYFLTTLVIVEVR